MNQTGQMQPQTLGDKIDQYRSIYDRRAALSAEVKALTAQLEALTPELLEQLDQLGIEKAQGKRASIRITEKTLPSVKDWDAFYEFIVENDAWYLLERRPTQKAYQELLDAGESVPGVEPFTKREIVSSKI